MNNPFLPTGLTIPDCECFKDTKAFAIRNSMIDNIIACSTQDIANSFFAMNFCDKSRDYFYSAMIFQMLIGCCSQYGKHIKKGGDLGRLEEHRQEIEATWNRIKPLVMQRIEYIDGLSDKAGIK